MSRFKPGDRVRLTQDYPGAISRGARRSAEAVVVGEEPHCGGRVLIDLGDGFAGHNGHGALPSSTGLYVEPGYLEPWTPHSFYLVALRPEGAQTVVQAGTYADGKAAQEAARHWSAQLGVKVQPRRVTPADAAAWREREAARLADGAYRPLPAGWDLPPIAGHYAHLSSRREGMIAYTPNDEYGTQDRRLRCRPGAYLARFYPDLPEERRQHYAALALVQGELRITTDADEVRDAYLDGPQSCMSHPFEDYPCHPSEVYLAGDLALAYLADDEGVYARCVVWPEKKRHTRPYGRDGTSGFDQILAALKAAGYTEERLLGARLRKVPFDGTYVCPYIDVAGTRQGEPEPEHVAIEADCLRIAEDGHRAGDYETALLPARATSPQTVCHCCEGEVDRRQTRRVRTHHGLRRYCVSCVDEHAAPCALTGDYYDIEQHTLHEWWGGGYVADTAVRGNPAYRQCDLTGVVWPAPLTVSMADGAVWSEEAFARYGFTCPSDGQRYARSDGVLVDGVWTRRQPDAA